MQYKCFLCASCFFSFFLKKKILLYDDIFTMRQKSSSRWGKKINLTHLLKVSWVSTGPRPCSTRLLMPHSALRGLRTDKYLSMCEWRKRDDSQPVSWVWSPGIKWGPAQWHWVTQQWHEDTHTRTHTHIQYFLSLSPYFHLPPSLSAYLSLTRTHTLIALSANSCQWHHPLGTVVSFLCTQWSGSSPALPSPAST